MPRAPWRVMAPMREAAAPVRAVIKISENCSMLLSPSFFPSIDRDGSDRWGIPPPWLKCAAVARWEEQERRRMALIKKVFPLPASPKTTTFSPSSTASRASFCSQDRERQISNSSNRVSWIVFCLPLFSCLCLWCLPLVVLRGESAWGEEEEGKKEDPPWTWDAPGEETMTGGTPEGGERPSFGRRCGVPEANDWLLPCVRAV
mmetsp:Transcript_11556/g.30767  ORF Transcript_11556/g.30767 Transcript_11556/m.30767 type:complete len:203 (+) Transcript_11556:4424-5032(+)